MKLIQSQDITEGAMIPEGALITIGDIIGWHPGRWHDTRVLEHYVCIRIPLPWRGENHVPSCDGVEYGPLALIIFFATGIAPMGRWWIRTLVRRREELITGLQYLRRARI